MKLKLLFQREEFPTVFNETLAPFLKETFAWEGEIFWSKGFRSTGRSHWVQSQANLIFPSDISPAVIISFCAEYGKHRNWIKQLLQTVYIWFASQYQTRRFLTSHELEFLPNCDRLNSLVFIPGNNTIRVAQPNDNRFFVLRKVNADERRTTVQIKLRKKYDFLLAPKILKSSKKMDWFTEQKIDGVPLNRLQSQGVRSNAIKLIQDNLMMLYGQTTKKVNVKEWLESQRLITKRLIAKSKKTSTDNYSKRWIDCYDKLTHHLVGRIEINRPIVTVMTHGDFQEANILTKDGTIKDTFLIDWEYCGRRTIAFDHLVNTLNTRNPHGLAARIRRYLTFASEPQYSQGLWHRRFQWDNLTVQQELALFLIEELLFRLEEASLANLRVLPNGSLVFLDEIHKFLNVRY